MSLVEDLVKKSIKSVVDNTLIDAVTIGAVSAVAEVVVDATKSAKQIKENDKIKGNDSLNNNAINNNVTYNNAANISMVYPSKNYDEFYYCNAKRTARIMLGCGFESVELIPEKIINKARPDEYGLVQSISINGDEEFSRKKAFPSNAYVVIEYSDFTSKVDSSVYDEVDVIQPGFFTRENIGLKAETSVKKDESKVDKKETSEEKDKVEQTATYDNSSVKTFGKNQCRGCGASAFAKQGSHYICEYCGLKYSFEEYCAIVYGKIDSKIQRENDIEELEDLLSQMNKAKIEGYEKLRTQIPILKDYDDSKLNENNIKSCIADKIEEINNKENENFAEITRKIRTKIALFSAGGHIFWIVVAILLMCISSLSEPMGALLALLITTFSVGIIFMFSRNTAKTAHIIISGSLLFSILMCFSTMSGWARILALLIIISDSLQLEWNSLILIRLKNAEQGEAVSTFPYKNTDGTMNMSFSYDSSIHEQEKCNLEGYLKTAENIMSETNEKIRAIKYKAGFDSAYATDENIYKMLQLLRSGKVNSIKEAVSKIGEINHS